jgi:hypothetical protein
MWTPGRVDAAFAVANGDPNKLNRVKVKTDITEERAAIR